MANSVLDLNWGGGFHSFLVALSGPIIGNFEGMLMFLHTPSALHNYQTRAQLGLVLNISQKSALSITSLLSSLVFAAGQAGITALDVYNPTIGRTLPYQVAAFSALDWFAVMS